MHGDVPETAVTVAPHALSMPACVQNIIYNMSFNALHVRRTKLFTFLYARACFEEYEHMCKTRLVCKQSAVLGLLSLPAVKLLRRRAHRYTHFLTRRRFGPVSRRSGAQ